MTELEEGTRQALENQPHANEVFAHPLPFNVIPHIDAFQSNGYTKEEMKVVWETQKIFGEKDLSCSCTAVRIPTKRAHSEAITIETEEEVTPEAATELLKAAPGVQVVDNPAEKQRLAPQSSPQSRSSQEALGWLKVQSVSVREAGHVDTEVHSSQQLLQDVEAVSSGW
ncbi:asd [Symbiodinium natans]|uniref:Asd protein n=1 Tax=Symbiodinium natans TaxID=878477 RepID=A0A812GH49_9DINO|nr:asd [Symbiodinium natans]